MSQWLDAKRSKEDFGLFFSNFENIAPGVNVHPINFALSQATPPFHTTYFQVLSQCETPLDSHQEEEIWIVLQGCGILNYEGSCHYLSAQDIFYFAAFKKHQVRNPTNELLLICSIYW
ncbi:cupin domain-containing protein [Legionella cincinnatiensis]|uniref:Cupin domain protein n=1 Tax=Legionella cincinnatiensis TaxID=28085 RepID=A0A378IFP3_9GAMM|nr:cupin domain-containing protein [Legionella cincinnatiensis]KTC86233.1 Cupin domain protein [Legionella cincinnatiensis]STX33843.1 Uncharacterized conserved protein, contains double-stranded beta-helix domain [Legionella cincinnatiensis]